MKTPTLPRQALLASLLLGACTGSLLQPDTTPGQIIVTNAHALPNLVSVQFRLNGREIREAFTGHNFTYANVGPGEHSLAFVGCSGGVCYFNGDGNVCNFSVRPGETKVVNVSGGYTNLVTITCPPW